MQFILVIGAAMQCITTFLSTNFLSVLSSIIISISELVACFNQIFRGQVNWLPLLLSASSAQLLSSSAPPPLLLLLLLYLPAGAFMGDTTAATPEAAAASFLSSLLALLRALLSAWALRRAALAETVEPATPASSPLAADFSSAEALPAPPVPAAPAFLASFLRCAPDMPFPLLLALAAAAVAATAGGVMPLAAGEFSSAT